MGDHEKIRRLGRFVVASGRGVHARGGCKQGRAVQRFLGVFVPRVIQHGEPQFDGLARCVRG